VTVLFVVTGHTRGLGASLVRHAITSGSGVIAFARRRDPDLDDRVVQVTADLAEPVEATAELRRALGAVTWAGVDIACLINNAGTLGTIRPVGRLEHRDTAAALNVDLVAPILLTDAFLDMTDGAAVERRVLNVSSGAARTPYSGWSAYCASKAGLDHFSRTVAAEAPPRCRIASVAPGIIDTDMQAEIRASDDADFPMKARFVAFKANGALARADVIAARLLDHLLSDDFGREVVTDLRALE
jgi:NAD(P)-dependent dehydrogenase (short-subunit alcohol dehydrogenase family)